MDQKNNNEKNKKKKPPVSKEKPGSSISKEQIRLLLKEVMLKNIEEEEIQRNVTLESISSTLEEFLRCFIVVGYNLDNEPVLISNAKTQLDADALTTALNKLFFSMGGKDDF
jgi:hypothetical protein